MKRRKGEKMKEVKQTNNYEIFKKLQGNRITDERRIEKIKKSILKVGYITSPILVNQNMEIIDGQGRFEALKQLQLPIEYIVQNDIGVKECIAMNVYQTNWKIHDYIKSYADKGVKSYIYLNNLMEKYSKKNINIAQISVAIHGITRFNGNIIRDGEIVITDEEYNNAINKLDLVKDIAENYKHIPRINLIVNAMLYCINIKGLDFERLKNKIIEILDYGKIPPIPTTDEAMQFMENIYNRNCKGPTLYIYTEHRKYIEAQLSKNMRQRNEKYRMKKYAIDIDNL